MNETQKAIPLDPQTEIDPLDMPASSAENVNDFPLLKAGKIVRFTVSKLEIVPAAKEGAPEGAENLKITVNTANEERSTDEQPLYPGYPVYTYIPLYAAKTDKRERTMKDVANNVGTFIQAVEGKDSQTKISMVRTNPDHFIGKLVDAKVSIKEDKTGKYGPSNQLRWIIPGQ